MPPALFSAGTYDHLIDDSMFMAARWEAAGNTAQTLLYPETPHGCTDLPTVDAHFFPRFTAFVWDCLATDPSRQ